MNDKTKTNHTMSRRGFLGSVAAVAATSVVTPSIVSCSTQSVQTVNNTLLTTDGKPNSKFNGVQIGASTYGFLREANGLEEVLKACIDANLSSIELRHDLESGLPGAPVRPEIPTGNSMSPAAIAAMFGGNAPASMDRGRGQQRELTDEEKAAQAKYEEDIKAFRNDPATMDKWADVRKRFNDAGISIHELKWTAGDSDEKLDYTCEVAKVLGAGGFSVELSEEAAKRYGAIAKRNGVYAIFHNHGQYANMTVDEIQAWLDYSPANMLEFDMGHYFGFGYENSTKLTINQFIDRFHDRIFNIHIKDKTSSTNEFASNQNQVWGQGETPLREMLQHIRDNYPNIYCDIEFEYRAPAWSNSIKETAKCVRYAREALI